MRKWIHSDNTVSFKNDLCVLSSGVKIRRERSSSPSKKFQIYFRGELVASKRHDATGLIMTLARGGELPRDHEERLKIRKWFWCET